MTNSPDQSKELNFLNDLIDQVLIIHKFKSICFANTNAKKRFGNNIDYASSDIKPILMRKVFDLNKKIKNKIKRTRDEATSNHLKYISMQLSEFTDN